MYYSLSDVLRLQRHTIEHPLAQLAAAAERRISGLSLGALASVLQGRFQLRRALRVAAPDLIYARNLPWLWATLPERTSFVLECHAPPPHAAAHRAIRSLIGRRGFRGLIVISNALKQNYVDFFPALGADRVLVAHDGADAPELTQPPERHEGFRIGYVGHLYPGRGAELILELAQRVPHATFHFVGGTPADVHRLRDQATENVIFHGHVPHAETGRHYRMFDVVLAPYQRKVAVHGGAGDTSAYMSPLKLFEYMAWAKPILCSDLPVLREVLTNGETALLLPPADADAWEAALRRLMEDGSLAARLGGSARAVLQRSYTWQARCRRVLHWIAR